MPVRMSPGECPICGAAHAACTGGSDRSSAIVVAQLPMRDAAAQAAAEREAAPTTISSEPFTTATARRKPRP